MYATKKCVCAPIAAFAHNLRTKRAHFRKSARLTTQNNSVNIECATQLSRVWISSEKERNINT